MITSSLAGAHVENNATILHFSNALICLSQLCH